MSINIGDNFSYLGKKFLDDREHFDTVAKMKACNDVPNGFITFCDETNTRYEYHVDNEVDTTLGKWRVFTSVPDVNFDEYVTQDELEEAIKDVDVTEQLQDYAKKSDIPSVPTKVSQLENDKGYLTEHQDISHLVTQEEFNELELIETSPTEPTDEDVVIWINTSEDTPMDVLARINDNTVANNTTWSSSKINNTLNNLQLEGGNGGNIDLNDYALKTELHSHNNKSVLDNITSDKITNWDNKSTFSGNYNDLTNKPTIPTIPTNISAFTNDSNYATESYVQTAIDNAQLDGGDNGNVDLEKYALKTELHNHSNKTVLDGITSDMTTKWNQSIPFNDTYSSDCNTWLTNGYIKTGDGITSNLPSVCTGADRWGVLFFVAENLTNGTGTQMYFPIDGTYKGRVFTRSLTNMKTTPSVGAWTLLSTFSGNYNDLTNKPTIPTVPTKTSQLTNDSNYLTSIPSEYITESELSTKQYATEGYVQTAIDNAQLSGDGEAVDMTKYALKSEVPTKTSQLTNDSNFLTSVPSEYITDSELNAKGYLTEHQSLENYALKTDIPSVPTKTSELTNDSNFLTSIPSEYVTDSELNAKGYLTEHQSLTDYAKKSELHNHDNKSVLDGITSAKVSSWDNKSTFDGNYNSLTNKPTIPTVTNDLTNALKSNYDTAYNHSQSSHAPSNAQKNSDITKTEIETKLTGDITSHTHSQYLTEHQSLTDYAKKTDIPSVPTKTSELTNDSNFLTSVPSEYITDTELNNKGYATTSQIPTSLPANGGNANTVGGYTIWTGTQAQYDAIATKSNTTLYFIKEG